MIPKREPITNAEIAYPYDWCIAGGFAACPDLASDCDVWVFGVPAYPGRGHRARVEILRRLRAAGVTFDKQENDPNKPTEWYDIGDGVLCWKVAALADGRHILLTDANSVDELLDRFDVSTHQVALTSDGELVRGDHFTPITVPPEQIRGTDNTAQRMQRVSQRYAHFSKTHQFNEIVDELAVNVIEGEERWPDFL